MAPYKVVKKWTEKDLIGSEDHKTWAGTGYTEYTYRIKKYERREYYNPDNGRVYTEDILVESYTNTVREGW